MADEKPVTVTMEATQPHSYHGKDYEVGDTYEADEGDVSTIEVQKKGVRVDADAPTTPAPKAKKK